MHLFLHRETDYSTDLIWNAQQVCERAYVCVLWILSSWWMYPCLSKCICMSLYGFSTYCSPAFWPQSRSKGSVGWAGPLEEEAEEPQTLEQQHPERQQTERQRDTKSGGGVDRKEREKRSVKKDVREIEEEIKKTKSLWVSETVQEALLSNSCTHFQSAFFCAAFFQAGLKRCSSRLGLRIDLISICFKSEAMARGGLVQRAKSCKHCRDPNIWQWWFVVRMTQQK